jgi:signal transduction histidine kinase
MSLTLIRRLSWVAFIVATLLFAFALGILTLNPSLADYSSWGTSGFLSAALFLVSTFAFPLVGMLILSSQPTNLIGWILLGIGLCWGLDGALVAYTDYAIKTGLPHADLVAALDSWLWMASIGSMGTFLLLLFPNGQLPSQSWRTVGWLSGIAIGAGSVAFLFMPGSLADAGYPQLTNPLGITVLKPLLTSLQLSIILMPLCIVAAAISLIQRFRRSGGIERIQLKWMTTGAAAVAILYVIATLATVLFAPNQSTAPLWVLIAQDLALFSFWVVPTAIGIAILKHRLYDIDVVINKTVVFGALAAFITLVYVAIVVGIGHAIGSGDKPNLALSILATAVVAIAFQPVRERVQHFANRLVYGQRATPYEVLAEFSERVAETYADQDVLPRMARTVAEGTGAMEAEVWLKSGNQLRPAASWPVNVPKETATRVVTDGQLPVFERVDKAIPVRHQGELLGALTVTKPAGESLTPAEEKLLSDLASQAGLVLRNVGLTSELLGRLGELKASRQRLVATQDQERRRLERDLHDGAQQHLVAVKMRLALAKRAARSDPAKISEFLSQVQDEAGEALETLRDLARGIYPPLLADQGLAAALEAQARKSPVSAEIRSESVSRYPQEIEAAIYFCCLEALQNVAKYAHATRVMITLQQRDKELSFSVTDDGDGFDPNKTGKGAGTQNMADRIEALGGSVTVRSAPGRGTTVAASLPVSTLESVA